MNMKSNLPKIQNHGINKDTLIKLHRDLLSTLDVSEQNITTFTEFARLHSQVLFYGVGDLGEIDSRLKTTIYSNFDPSYGGLNHLIKNDSTKRSYEEFSEWVLEQFKFAERFYTRQEVDSETEQGFLDLIDSFEVFLQGLFAKTFMPLLIEIENDVKSELEIIYGEDLSNEEKQEKAFEYLEAQEKEIVARFTTELQQPMEDKALETFLEVLALLGLAELSKDVLDTELKKARFGYVSNITAFFSNSFRRVKEIVFENIYSQRDLKTEQLEVLSFNKNDYKLSLLAHARGYFRGLVYQASKGETDEFKLVVPPSVEPSLNPKGVTKKHLGKVKTFDQWSTTEGVSNINVVNGLGLHHGSQEYYYPLLSQI